MSQKQTPAPLEKLISYFAGYDSLAHFTPSWIVRMILCEKGNRYPWGYLL
jgi:ligand-binding SRPBCC domain-containing protein